MKRFYTEAATEPAARGHRILLDGRPVRTPGGLPLIVPTRALARVLADEWARQGETIEPTAMPLTRLAATALERTPAARKAVADEIAAYARTDLLCYRAAAPFELVQRQQRAWQPLLDWAAVSLGARLAVTTGVLPVVQDPGALDRIRAAVAAADDWALTGLHAATTALGSVVLALALHHRRLEADAALATSLLDEVFELERWGHDAETARRHRRLRQGLEAAALLLGNRRDA